ncbi:uncharacterized protein LOC136033627 isoform X2 [Artemia franciscana]|uniref:Uncharacterized protein n=1 Tax=Artemia franciscana TaxID=6661 RepID=A0AA88I717_ARTSF|nr:hypothetical protein QYM36_002287 [Artemia franciscana]
MLRNIVLALACVAASAEDGTPGLRFFIGRTTSTQFACSSTTIERVTSTVVTSCVTVTDPDCRRRRRGLEVKDIPEEQPAVEGNAAEPEDIKVEEKVSKIAGDKADVPDIEGSQELEEVRIIGLEDSCPGGRFIFNLPKPLNLLYVTTIHTLCTSLSSFTTFQTNTLTVECSPAFGVNYC